MRDDTFYAICQAALLVLLAILVLGPLVSLGIWLGSR